MLRISVRVSPVDLSLFFSRFNNEILASCGVRKTLGFGGSLAWLVGLDCVFSKTTLDVGKVTKQN